MRKISEFTKEDWFKLAVIVDPWYEGKQDFINVEDCGDFKMLSTTSTGECSMIRVEFNNEVVTRIMKGGKFPSGWKVIPRIAYDQIRESLQIQTNLLTNNKRLAVQLVLDEIEELKKQINHRCWLIQNKLSPILPESTKVKVVMNGPYIYDYRGNQYGYNISFKELYAYLDEHKRDHLKESDWDVLDDLPF